MKNAEANPKLPFVLVLSIVLAIAGCSSEKQPASSAAADQSAPQQSTAAASGDNTSPGTSATGGDAAADAAATAATVNPTLGSKPDYNPAAEASEQRVAEKLAEAPEDRSPEGLQKKVELLKSDEAVILKYLDKVHERLETEQDPNFRKGYEYGLATAEQNLETTRKDLASTEKELAERSASPK
jgi:hypothetical protein